MATSLRAVVSRGPHLQEFIPEGWFCGILVYATQIRFARALGRMYGCGPGCGQMRLECRQNADRVLAGSGSDGSRFQIDATLLTHVAKLAALRLTKPTLQDKKKSLLVLLVALAETVVDMKFVGVSFSCSDTTVHCMHMHRSHCCTQQNTYIRISIPTHSNSMRTHVQRVLVCACPSLWSR